MFSRNFSRAQDDYLDPDRYYQDIPECPECGGELTEIENGGFLESTWLCLNPDCENGNPPEKEDEEEEEEE